MKTRSHQTTRHQRRLTFERCEPRLTLSGDGGFIEFDVSDYLSLGGSDFLANGDSLYADNSTLVLSIPRSTGLTSVNTAIDSAAISQRFFQAASHLLNSGHQLSVNFIDFEGNSSIEVLGAAVKPRDLQDLIEDHLLVDGPAGTQVPEPPFEPASLLPALGPLESGNTRTVETKTSAILEDDTPLASFSRETSTGEIADSSSLPPITAMEALLLARKDAELKDAAEGPDSLAEGGPIAVDEAVAAAQRAHESELFAEVAAQLDGRHALAQADSPDAKPLVGELARAVVFEVVGQEPAADETTPRDESHAPSAAVSGVSDPTVALAIKGEREEHANSRALAFAEWPLYFSVALGGVLATRRRRSQADAAQLPPRRRTGQLFSR